MESQSNNLPVHVACIMDGNGRWAKERGLTRREGHRAGAETVSMMVDECKELSIPWLTLFAFSSENWKRPKLEIHALMELLHEFLKRKSAEMINGGIRLHAIGDLNRLPAKTRKLLNDTMAKTAANTSMNIVLALSYGARNEILHAVKELAAKAALGEIDPNAITEETFSRHLYTAHIPDPDLLVRTGGEFRISNFLLWQISYSEFYVTDKYWPDFTKHDFHAALAEYSSRQRRFGAL